MLHVDTGESRLASTINTQNETVGNHSSIKYVRHPYRSSKYITNSQLCLKSGDLGHDRTIYSVRWRLRPVVYKHFCIRLLSSARGILNELVKDDDIFVAAVCTRYQSLPILL